MKFENFNIKKYKMKFENFNIKEYKEMVVQNGVLIEIEFISWPGEIYKFVFTKNGDYPFDENKDIENFRKLLYSSNKEKFVLKYFPHDHKKIINN